MMLFTKKIRSLLALGVLTLTQVLFCEEPNWCYKFNPYQYCDQYSFYGAFLYWKINGAEFDYAVHKIRNEINREEVLAQVKDRQTIHNIQFDWESGVRFGVKADFPNGDLNCSWTHYDNSSSKSKEFEGTVAPLISTYVNFPVVYNFGTLLDPVQAIKIRGRISFRYNIVDFDLGKWCCFEGIQLRPHAGIRIADIKESFHDKIFFNRTAIENFSNTNAIQAGFYSKNKFKGAGIRAGLDLNLPICQGWSIIGGTAASLIWGITHLKQQFKYTTAEVLDFYTGYLKESYRNNRIITDLFLGLRYCFDICECYPVVTEISWEHHCLFHQQRFWVDNSFFTPDAETSNSPLQTISSWKKNGDVVLQGLVISAEIKF